MQLFRVIVPLLALVIPALSTTETITDLIIDRVYVPEDCPVTAKAGDKLEVHYTGTLFSNGNKFDSR